MPVVSIIFGFLIGCLMFLPFPGWQVLVGFIVSAAVLGYAMVPLAFGAMRRQEPDHPRPFKLPAGEVLAPIAFIVANLVIYWTGWDILVVAAFSLAIYFYAISVRLTPEEVRSHVADARDEAEEEEELAV